MLGMFAALKLIMFVVIQIYCKLPVFVLILMILGAVFEYVSAIAMDDYDNTFVREFIIYLPSILLQVLPIYIVSFGYLGLADGKLNFIMAVAAGWVTIVQAILWFINGFEGLSAFAYTYGASIIILVVNAILSSFMALPTLLVVNLVLGAISMLVITIARFKLGSNME